MKHRPNQQKQSEYQKSRGFALLVVIVVMLLTSFLASQLILQVRAEQQVAHNIKTRAAGRFLSEAGLNLALFRLLDKPLDITDEDYETFLLGHAYVTFLDKGRVSYAAISESGKIDLNRSPQRLLELFLEYQGLDNDQVATITDSLLDWRDPDDLHRLNGAEQETYEALKTPYIPRNGAIEEVAEFPLIHGTDVLPPAFEPEEVFTVHNPQGKINFNSATPAILDFLTAGDEDRKTAYQEAQKMYPSLNAALARQILGDERFDLLSPYLTYSTANNQYYAITATGRAGVTPDEEESAAKPGTRISLLVRITGATYQLLAWKEQTV